MKVVVSNGLATDHFVGDLRGGFPDVNFRVARSRADEGREIVDTNVFAGRPDRALFAAAGDSLRWIHNRAAGVDWLEDMPALVESDVVLTNRRGAHAGAMADQCLHSAPRAGSPDPGAGADGQAYRWPLQGTTG